MRRIDSIEPFRVMQLLEHAKQLEAQGQHIIHMEIGEPDFLTPTSIIDAAHHALDKELFYTPSTGLSDLQIALASWYQQEYGLSIAPDRFLITPGSSGAFNMLYAALLDTGDSVLLPDPGYPCQRNFIRLAGAKAINIPVDGSSQFHLTAKLIEKHWQKHTRAALLINPSNPTGTLINIDAMQELTDACVARGGHLISDEIYHGLNYAKHKPSCALSMHPHAIIVNSFSKRWAMTGWRIGWAIVPEYLIDPCRRVMQNIFISAPTLSQYVAIEALKCRKECEDMRLAYAERRQLLLQELPKLGFKIAVEPQGAFYIYADVSRLCNDSRDFCWHLLNTAGVAITPGEDFGQYRASEHVRFSYATSLSDIREGIARIAFFLKKIA